MTPREHLTQKEIEIATLVWEGMTNREIGRIIGTSEQVIKNYLRSTFDKLGVWSRLELAMYVASHGGRNWIAPPPPRAEIASSHASRGLSGLSASRERRGVEPRGWTNVVGGGVGEEPGGPQAMTAFPLIFEAEILRQRLAVIPASAARGPLSHRPLSVTPLSPRPRSSRLFSAKRFTSGARAWPLASG